MKGKLQMGNQMVKEHKLGLMETYLGNWNDGKQNGQGTLTSSDGTKYVGEWKDGVFHGQGTLTSQDGRKEVGLWRENQPWNSIEYDKNGNTIGKVITH